MNQPVRRFVLRSLGATAIGWLAPTAILYALPMNGTLISRGTGTGFIDGVLAHAAGFLAFSVITSFWIVPTWLLVVLPVALFVPHMSRFWHPAVVGPVGLIAGGAILVSSIAILTSGSGELQIRSLLPLAALAAGIGLVCGIALSILIPERKRPNPARPVSFTPPR
jgi:hypothetical protein